MGKDGWQQSTYLSTPQQRWALPQRELWWWTSWFPGHPSHACPGGTAAAGWLGTHTDSETAQHYQWNRQWWKTIQSLKQHNSPSETDDDGKPYRLCSTTSETDTDGKSYTLKQHNSPSETDDDGKAYRLWNSAALPVKQTLMKNHTDSETAQQSPWNRWWW